MVRSAVQIKTLVLFLSLDMSRSNYYGGKHHNCFWKPGKDKFKSFILSPLSSELFFNWPVIFPSIIFYFWLTILSYESWFMNQHPTSRVPTFPILPQFCHCSTGWYHWSVLMMENNLFSGTWVEIFSQNWIWLIWWIWKSWFWMGMKNYMWMKLIELEIVEIKKIKLRQSIFLLV